MSQASLSQARLASSVLTQRSDQHQRRHHHSPYDQGLRNPERSETDPLAPPILCSHCRRIFWVGEDVRDAGHHFCMEAIWLHCRPLQLGSDRSPENLALGMCALCLGLPAQKSVFMNLKELQMHYVLGHFGRSLKELFYSKFLGCILPVKCMGCPKWKGCGQWLRNEEQVILHLGLIHQ